MKLFNRIIKSAAFNACFVNAIINILSIDGLSNSLSLIQNVIKSAIEESLNPLNLFF